MSIFPAPALRSFFASSAIQPGDRPIARPVAIESRPTPHHWQLLAGARFAMAMIVVAAHVLTWATGTGVFSAIARLGAFTAVLCFLVLSGYSIAHSVTKEPRGFYRRRVLRIYPLYVMAVLICLVHYLILDPGVHGGPFNRLFLLDLAGNLLFLQTYVAHPLGYNPVLWTLAVEVACYALAPILVRLKTQTLFKIAALSATAFVLTAHYHKGYYAFQRGGVALLALGWAWLAGFIYYRCRSHPHAGAILIAAALALMNANALYNAKYSFLTMSIVLVLLVAGGALRLPSALGKVMSYLGDLSYPLYLFHGPVYLWAYNVLHLQNAWIYVGAGILAGMFFLEVDRRIKAPMDALADGIESAWMGCRASIRALVDRAAHAMDSRSRLRGGETASVAAALD